jgi:hypothetical protein
MSLSELTQEAKTTPLYDLCLCIAFCFLSVYGDSSQSFELILMTRAKLK